MLLAPFCWRWVPVHARPGESGAGIRICVTGGDCAMQANVEQAPCNGALLPTRAAGLRKPEILLFAQPTSLMICIFPALRTGRTSLIPEPFFQESNPNPARRLAAPPLLAKNVFDTSTRCHRQRLGTVIPIFETRVFHTRELFQVRESRVMYHAAAAESLQPTVLQIERPEPFCFRSPRPPTVNHFPRQSAYGRFRKICTPPP